MKKEKLKDKDLLVFRNGVKVIYSDKIKWVIRHYYNDDLECPSDPNYDIMSVLRPYYEEIYQRKDLNR